MMELIQWCFAIFSFFFIVAAIGYIGGSIRRYISKKRGAENEKRKSFFDEFPEKWRMVLKLILWIGALNFAFSVFFSEPTIGAFYEKRRYEAEYYALISIEKDDAECQKIKVLIERDDGEYLLTGVYYGDVLQDYSMWGSLEINERIPCEINGHDVYIELLNQKVE